jgi:hypothetical protein
MKMVKALIMAIITMAFFSSGGYAAELGAIDVHGFISQGYLQSTANDYLVKSNKGSFEYNEVGINFSTNLSDKLRLGMQLMARDLGDAGNNQVQLDWGYADYRWRNELGLRVGKIKAPVGFYNETRDTDSLRTWVLLPQSIYDESYRDFIVALEGGSIYGTLDAGKAGSFEYQDVLGTLGNMNLEPTNVGNQLVKVFQPYLFLGQTITPDDLQVTPRKFNTLQLVWNAPLEGLRLGATWTVGKFDLEVPAMSQTMYVLTPGGPVLVKVDFPQRQAELKMERLLTLSGEYKWKDLSLAAEYKEQKVGLAYDTPELEPAMAAYGLDLPSTVTTQGYYGAIAYRLTDWLELGTYYSVYYSNKTDKKGEDVVADAALLGQTVPDYQAWQKDNCFTARFDINPYWCFKLEGHHMNGTALVFDYTDVNDLSKIWTLYAAKASFSF